MSKNNEQKNVRKLTGVVTKLSSKDTIKVKVELKSKHNKYNRIVKSDVNYLVHCTNAEVQVGDTVEIMSVRPISKLKNWTFVSKLGQAK